MADYRFYRFYGDTEDWCTMQVLRPHVVLFIVEWVRWIVIAHKKVQSTLSLFYQKIQHDSRNNKINDGSHNE